MAIMPCIGVQSILLFCLLILQGFSPFSAEKCRILYFMERNCPEKCKEIDEIILPRLTEIYGDKIEVTKLDLEIQENFETLMAFEKEYGVRQERFRSSTRRSEQSRKPTTSVGN